MIRIPLTLLGLEREVESGPELPGPSVKRRQGSGELARRDGRRKAAMEERNLRAYIS